MIISHVAIREQSEPEVPKCHLGTVINVMFIRLCMALQVANKIISWQFNEYFYMLAHCDVHVVTRQFELPVLKCS